MQRTTMVALLLVSAGALLAAGWWLGRQAPMPEALTATGELQRERPDAARGTVADLQLDRPVSAPPEASAPASPAASGSAPLPPLDAPLDSVFDELADRARRGEARAACRLAVELQRCRRAGYIGRGSRRLESMAAQEDDLDRRESMIGELARIEAERERSETVCSGVTGDQLAQAFAFQQQAAQAMPELRTWAATHPALDAMNFVNELDAWQQYRHVALPWLEQAALDGDPAALIALVRIHGQSDRRGFLFPPIRQPDDERYLLYASLLERRGISTPPLQRGLARVRRELDPATVARVQDQAEALAAQQPSASLMRPDLLRRAFSGSGPEPADCG